MVVTAKVDLSDNGVRKTVFIRDSEVLKIKSYQDGSIVYHGSDHNPKKTRVYESPSQIQQAKEPETYTASIQSAGSVQGDATQLYLYLNVVTDGIEGGGVKIPDTNVCRVDNESELDVLVYPPVGENFQFLAVNAPYTLAPGGSVFFTKD